jgi:hypothetical protein
MCYSAALARLLMQRTTAPQIEPGECDDEREREWGNGDHGV